MNYAASRKDIMMPIVSITMTESFYITPAAISALTLFMPCVQILSSSFILPCSQEGQGFQLENWSFLGDEIHFWVVKGLNFILAMLEGLFMQQLVSLATLANFTTNFYGLIVLNRILTTAIR